MGGGRGLVGSSLQDGMVRVGRGLYGVACGYETTHFSVGAVFLCWLCQRSFLGWAGGRQSLAFPQALTTFTI